MESCGERQGASGAAVTLELTVAPATGDASGRGVRYNRLYQGYTNHKEVN